MKSHITSMIVCVALFVSVFGALAQTPPASETTFTEVSITGSDYLWITSANWSNGVPTATTTSAATDDARIEDGATAYHDLNTDGVPEFGSLTLGVGSTFQFKSASAGALANSNNQLSNSPAIYLSDGSHFEMTAGLMNSDADYYVLANASATNTHASSHSKPRGTLTGDSTADLTIIVQGSPLDVRWNAANYTGNLTYESNNGGARVITIGQHGGNTSTFGPGITTLANAVQGNLALDDRISNSGTLRLVGGAGGGSNQKFYGGADKGDTFAKLIIVSPIASTGPYIYGRNDWLDVTDSVSFEGTAATVEIDSYSAFDGSWPFGINARGADISFGGSGTWAVTGAGGFWLDGSSTISNDVDVSISCPVKLSSAALNKYGEGALTIDGSTNLFSPTSITIDAGSLILATKVPASVTGVTLGALGAHFGAEYHASGQFETIDDVNAELDGFFEITSVDPPDGALRAFDGGSGFTVILGPPSVTMFTFQ